MTSSTNDAHRGFVVDRFRVESSLGRGGMGEVYKAYDTVLERTVAVKTLTPGNADPQAVQRLLREARACARLTHPGIVTIHDVLEAKGRVYVVMEHLPGASLEVLHRFPRLASFEAKVGIIIRILEALHYAHGRGVVHRDIKPRNVQILPDGTVRLLDFGIAHVAGVDALTVTGTVTGTAHYASPEQLRGEESGASTDVYSTGILAYEILARRRPFEGDSVAAVLAKVLHDPLPPMDMVWSESFPEIEHIVRRATAKRSQDRYASAEDMRNALAAFLASSGSSIVTKQAEVLATTERVIVEAKSLIASGRMDEATSLLATVLRSNPDAEEARALLNAGQDASSKAMSPPPATLQTGEGSTVLVGTKRTAPSFTAPVAEASVPAPDHWSRPWIALAAAPVLLALLGAVLLGPSWIPRESPGAESASTPSDSLSSEPATGLSSLRLAAPMQPVESSQAAPEGARSMEPPTSPAAATAMVADRTPESTGARRESAGAPGRVLGPAPASVASSPPPPAAVAPAPAIASDPEIPAPPTRVSSAKNLYYADAPIVPGTVANQVSTSVPSAAAKAGIKYRILRQESDGTAVEVDPDIMFRSGDRIRFAFEPNTDGFLYVVQQGSTGRWSVLLPHPLINGGRNAVTRFGEVAIPPEGWFRFDENPGSERVFIYLSKEPLTELPWGGGPVISAQSVDQPTMIKLANSVRSRDLVFEREAAPGSADQAAYVVNQDAVGGPVAWTLELHHR